MHQTVAVHTDSGLELFSPEDDPGWQRAIEESRLVVRLQGDEAEACGYILQTVDGPRLHAVPNISTEPGTFDMSAEECFVVYEWLAEGKLLGIWHSHPNGSRRPSKADWLNHPHGVPMYLVVLENNEEAMVLRYDDDSRPGKAQTPDQ